jgi:hypothetical protein
MPDNDPTFWQRHPALGLVCGLAWSTWWIVGGLAIMAQDGFNRRHGPPLTKETEPALFWFCVVSALAVGAGSAFAFARWYLKQVHQ